jgi:hypothetical protein
MHLPIKVKSPNNINKWQMEFNSAFKGLITIVQTQEPETQIECDEVRGTFVAGTEICMAWKFCARKFYKF